MLEEIKTHTEKQKHVRVEGELTENFVIRLWIETGMYSHHAYLILREMKAKVGNAGPRLRLKWV